MNEDTDNNPPETVPPKALNSSASPRTLSMPTTTTLGLSITSAREADPATRASTTVPFLTKYRIGKQHSRKELWEVFFSELSFAKVIEHLSEVTTRPVIGITARLVEFGETTDYPVQKNAAHTWPTVQKMIRVQIKKDPESIEFMSIELEPIHEKDQLEVSRRAADQRQKCM